MSRSMWSRPLSKTIKPSTPEPSKPALALVWLFPAIAPQQAPPPSAARRRRWGQTLTASTSDIADDDGLTNVTYSYQWLADDAEIEGATNSTYTVQTSDNGKVIKVRVTFTDDAGNEELLTSEGTSAVVMGGL